MDCGTRDRDTKIPLGSEDIDQLLDLSNGYSNHLFIVVSLIEMFIHMSSS